MASTTLADYQVLRDTSFTLGEFDHHTLHWQISSDFHGPSSGSRKPVMAFKIRPLENDTSFEILLHERKVIGQSNFDASHTRGYSEAFGWPDFGQGGFPNPVPVKFEVTGGSARFSDVVVWYQINRNS